MNHLPNFRNYDNPKRNRDMKEEYKKLYAVVYRDDGPKGPCGQSMSFTRKWTRVYLFNTEDEALKWKGSNPIAEGRKNPYYAICGEGYDDSVKPPKE